jgi:hypothetical protein
MNKCGILIISLLFTAIPVFTQELTPEETIPPIIEQGFKKYKMKGWRDALEEWYHYSHRITDEGDSLTVTALDKARSVFGKYIDYEIVDKMVVSNRNNLVYLTINHEKGPLFVLFTLYYPDNKWIISRIKASIDINDVFPGYLWTSSK